MNAHTTLDEADAAAPPATQGPSTSLKRLSAPVSSDPTPKRSTARSNLKSATDKLLEDRAIDDYAWYFSKKRRYVTLKLSEMLNALCTLYTSFFKAHWTDFARTMDRFPHAGTPASSGQELLAICYLTHWVCDTYRGIRRSLQHLDPVAFNEKYHTEIGTSSDVYDNFLSILNAHMRPTHITLAYADELYIPVLDKNMSFESNAKAFSWNKYYFNHDLLMVIINLMNRRKICKLTPLTSDLQGRPSWLFDWNTAGEAYAWFPQEANYNDDDITIAYIIGVACTPKMGHTDIDDWKYVAKEPQPRTFDLSDYVRVAPRRYKGSIEFRTFEMQQVALPLYHFYGDKAKADEWKAANKGPLAIVEDLTKSLSSQTIADPEEVVEETLADYVPDSPRHRTRSTASTSALTPWRTRVTDHLYYRQVIRKMNDTSRRTAFQMMLRAD